MVVSIPPIFAEVQETIDITEPKIIVPSDIHIRSSEITPITFSIYAIDDVDGIVPVQCDKMSGSLFELGQTTVRCMAEDSRGNMAWNSFVVTVGFEIVKIPDWVKNTVSFWINGHIDDQSFTHTIEYLLQNDIIQVPYAGNPTDSSEKIIPVWIKMNAEHWVNDDISDDEFSIGLEWFITNGIIKV